MVEVIHRGVRGIGEDEAAAVADSLAKAAFAKLNLDPEPLYTALFASGYEPVRCPKCGEANSLVLRTWMAGGGAIGDRFFCHHENADICLVPNERSPFRSVLV